MSDLSNERGVTIHVPSDTIANALIGAFYGAIGYWGSVKSVKRSQHYPADLSEDFRCWEASPLGKGGRIRIIDREGDGKVYVLDGAALERGLIAMAKGAPVHFGNLISGNDDATTHDVFVQCCLFGKILYG